MANRKILRWLARRGLRRSRLRGTLAHRVFGKALFASDLWAFNKRSVARGWIIGCVSACNPFLGLQVLMGLPFAFIFRGNLLVMLALIMTTNPLTIVPFLLASFRVGRWITHLRPTSADIGKLPELGIWQAFKRALDDANFSTTFLNTVVGSLAIGVAAALLGWLVIQLLWRAPPAATRTAPSQS